MKPLSGLALLAGFLPAVFQQASAQTYNVGDTVGDFTLNEHGTGRAVRLSDFEGKIVFLEWFAWW